MANRAKLNTVLTVCGFSTGPQRNFIMNTEGPNSWIAFTSIDYDDISSISKNASRHTAPFSLGVLKQKRLAALKFWIEHMIRMNEPHTAATFTPQVMVDYIKLYAVDVKEKFESVEFVYGPQFDPDLWVEFATGTEKYLASIQGNMEFLYPTFSGTTIVDLLSQLLMFAIQNKTGMHQLLGLTLTMTTSVSGLIWHNAVLILPVGLISRCSSQLKWSRSVVSCELFLWRNSRTYKKDGRCSFCIRNVNLVK